MPDLPPPPGSASEEGRLSEAEIRFERRRRRAGLVLGPAAFALLLAFPPGDLGLAPARLLAVVSWVLVWWITEAVPLPVTAVLGPALTVVLGVVPVKDAFAPFGDPIIFLFLGSFLLARAMSVHGLDRRLARAVLALPAASSSPKRIVWTFAALGAALSMWLSNSATTAMLFPIALGVLGTMDGERSRSTPLARSLLLACAYGSSVGGIGTPVGSPPNLVAIGQLSSLAGIHVGFVPWLLVAAPVMAVLLLFVGLVLGLPARQAGPVPIPAPGSGHSALPVGPMTSGERSVTSAFLLTVALWVAPGIASLVLGTGHAWSAALARALPEGAVAVLGAALLFVLPAGGSERRGALTWGEATEIDWGTLLLFGGGLSLGGAMFRLGLSEALGRSLVSATGVSSTVGLTVVFSIFSIFFTEITSNTAAATMLVPLAIASARAAGASPLEPALGCALGCSMAFMLPVATPPNAIVYGSGLVPVGTMARAGLWMNLAACVVIPAGVLLLVPVVMK
ncbi:MAG: SLC13/DASS family transporter [Holophagales bacterium]|nr:SLC13/DASS family transporter [Holophagales bacterium]